MPVSNHFSVARPTSVVIGEISRKIETWLGELAVYEAKEVGDLRRTLLNLYVETEGISTGPIYAHQLGTAAIQADARYEIDPNGTSGRTEEEESAFWALTYFEPALRELGVLINPRILVQCVIAADQGWQITNGTRRHWVGDWLRELLMEHGVVISSPNSPFSD